MRKTSVMIAYQVPSQLTKRRRGEREYPQKRSYNSVLGLNIGGGFSRQVRFRPSPYQMVWFLFSWQRIIPLTNNGASCGGTFA